MKPLHIRSILRRWPAVVALVAVAGCGGGGGDTAGNANTPGFTQSTFAGSEQLVNTFAASLTSAQETPPTTSTAQGSATAVLDPTTRELVATITTRGITGTAANIHEGAPGVNGRILFPLTENGAGSGIWSARVTLTDVQIADLRTGNWYFNVQSSALPGGEIRGQILLQQPGSTAGSGSATFTTGNGAGVGATTGTGTGIASAGVFVAALRGSQETPPTPSAAEGSGTALVDAGTRVLIAAVTTTGITGTAAHIQAGPPGASGPVVFPLSESTQGSGVWTTRVTLTDTQLAALQAGSWYFNVHSSAFPNGEIRGQILPLLRVVAVGNGTATTGANPGTGGVGTTGTGTIGTTGTGIGTSGTGATGTGIGSNTGIGSPTGFGSTIGTGSPTGFGSTIGTGSPTGFGSTIGTGSPTGFGSTTSTGSPTGFGSTIGTGSPTGFGSTTSTGSPTGFGSTIGTGLPTGFGSTTSTGSPTGFGSTTSTGSTMTTIGSSPTASAGL
jgi:hypothetical protein